MTVNFIPDTDNNFGFIPDVNQSSTALLDSQQKLDEIKKNPNYFQRVAGAYKQAGEEIVSGVTKGGEQYLEGAKEGGIKGLLKSTGGILRSGLRAVGGMAKAALAPITEAPIIKPTIEKVVSPIVGTALDLTGISQPIQDFAIKHPEAFKDLQNIVDITTLGAGKAVEKSLISATEKGAERISTKIGEKIIPKTEAEKAISETKIIQEKISPKPTVKEARVAQSEGRLVKGKESTLLRSSKPDVVLPSEKVVRSSQTIQEQIPNASKMTNPELYTALDKKISETAKNLKPEMARTPIKPETIEKINADLKTLQARQMEQAPANLEANVLKRQKSFEKFLQKSKNENMDDLWNTRKSYDDSIPTNVKNATEQSAPDIYQQHQEWLDNRSILNNAINDAENGLGQTSRKAFSGMSDMYNAQHNLQTTAKIETKVKPSKLVQWTETPTGKIVKRVGAVLGIGEAGRRVITGKW